MASTVRSQPYEVSAELPAGVKLAQVEYQGNPLSFAYSGNPEKPGIIFIHGTPGSWQAFGGYLADRELQQQFFMISVDRLGWGGSAPTSAPQKFKSFDHQAGAILQVMRAYKDKRWLIVGHSLGASIAPKIAVKDPQAIAGLLLLAGSIKPSLGGARWYNLAASMMVVRWLLPDNLKYSNDEIMSLRAELKELDQQVKAQTFSFAAVHIQGMKDKLVSPKNAQYTEQQWSKQFDEFEVIELPEAGHFLPWENAELVKKTIREFSF